MHKTPSTGKSGSRHAALPWAFAGGLLLLAHSVAAQTPAEPVTASAEAEDETIVLSPFVVESSEDADGYAAKSTLAGTRVRTELKDVASAISVVTKQFMQDTGATDSSSLLQYTANTEVAGVRGNFANAGSGGGTYNEASTLLRPNNSTRVRGLDAADNTRDYFLTEIPWDSYIVDRVDLQRGPNSILFGVGSPAGIINTSVNTAGFKNANSVENRVDEHGSIRTSLDVNYVVVEDLFSVRVAALDEHSKFEQDPAFEDDQRLFAAIRLEPKLFGDSAHTLIRANYEHGEIEANRPRALPPVDQITPWFFTGTDAYGVPGLNKRTQNAATDDRSRTIWNNYAWYGGSGVGRQFWPSTVAYYDTNGNATPGFYQSPMISAKNGIGSNGAVDGNISGQFFVRPFSINNFDDYANKAGIPGGAYYGDKSLSDPSIFNFFELLMDGDNKREWQNWDSANIAIAQTLFDSRLGFELVYDYQRYDDGQTATLGHGGAYTLSIDINSHLSDGRVNPNAGRPFVASSTEGGNNAAEIERDGLRFTTFAELRAEDLLGRNRLASILGRHVFTGLLSEDTKRTESYNWAQHAATADYATLIGENPPSLNTHVRAYDWQAYLGSSLINASSAAGANIDRIHSIIEAPQSAQVRYFDSRWNRSLSPGNSNYVDPAATYTYVDSSGNTVTSTQSENPANYGGWTTTTVNFLSADRGDIDSLYTSASKEHNVVNSRAITWQGYFFDGNFVPVFGWRRDEVKLRLGDATPDTLGVVSRDFNYDATRDREAAGESKSWGGVLHTPDFLSEKLPGNTKLSLIYNRSENFKADAPRQDVFGQIIANPIGETEEYGFAVTTLDDKLTLKVNWYETKVQNATISGDTGFNYLHWAVPAWGVAHVAAAQAGLAGQNNANSWLWNYAGNAGVPGGPGDAAWEAAPQTQTLRAAVADWKNLPLMQSFFNSYGRELAEIDVSKVQAGDYMGAWPKWAQGRADPQPGSSTNRVAAGDTTSKGIEFELVAQPTRNWNLSLNVSKVQATRTSVSPTIAAFMDEMTDFLAGPAGDLRIWGGGDTFRKVWADEALTRYDVLLTQIGSSAPEIPEWRSNAVTTYSFNSGPLKGSWIGGAYRWEDERILGYAYSEDINGLDVSQPLYGPDDFHVDLWVGYSRKLTSRINWRIQLNLRNVGEDTTLVPVTLQPDGSTALSRIQEGMSWQLTNTFSF